MVTLHLLLQPTVLIAFCREVDVLSDKVAIVVSEQKEGDFVGDFEIVGLNVEVGLAVGANVGNFVGTLLGVVVGLEARSAKEPTVPSSHT